MSWLGCGLVLAFVVAACGGGGSSAKPCTASNPDPYCGTFCSGTTPCRPGYFCDAGTCTNECTRNSHCSGGQICNAIGDCVDPTANNGPCDQSPPHPDCGVACNPTIGCNEYFYCEGGVCGSDCDATTGCIAGQMCERDGRCVPYIPPREDMGRPDIIGEGCPNIDVTAQGVPPNVLIVLDRSDSMHTADIGGMERWDVALAAINTFTTMYDNQVRFGLGLYPGTNLSCSAGMTCGAGYVEVAPAPMMATTINGQLNPPGAAAGTCMFSTPIGAMLNSLVNYSGLEDTTRNNYVVLITDGEDNCAGSDPPGAAANLLDETPPVPTFVIGFSADTDPTQLNTIARSGGTERVPGMNTGTSQPDDYYFADSSASLQMAFSDIVEGVISCDLTLNGSLSSPSTACADGTIRLNGGMLTCQGANCAASDGWCVVNSTTIRLLGTDCATFQNTANANVNGSFRCGTINPF